MKKFTLAAAGIALLAACEPQVPLADYRPIVDPGRTNSAKFEKDLTACRQIALQVEADYKERQQKELAANIVAGLILGAVVGAAVGDSGDWAAYGAASGAAAGAASGDYTHDLVKYGPRRIVDRCMAERGHAVLNDAGRA